MYAVVFIMSDARNCLAGALLKVIPATNTHLELKYWTPKFGIIECLLYLIPTKT